jgi:hypothetical protein
VNQPIVPGRLPVTERAAIMERRLRDLTFRGYRVETADGPRAIVLTGEPVNHVLHVLLTIFTCGLWLPVWLLLIGLGGVKRRQVHIDEYGNFVGL